jgi:HAE1 family hydrophobic/amphiphilic exporter-1
MGDSYTIIEPLVKQIMDVGKTVEGIVFRYTDLAPGKPEIQVRVDAERAANLGFHGKDIADAVEAAGGGQRSITQYDVGGRYFFIQVMGRESDLKDINDVGRILLTSPLNPRIHTSSLSNK